MNLETAIVLASCISLVVGQGLTLGIYWFLTKDNENEVNDLSQAEY